ncbi:MAG: prolyl oligopeptidase family serine peptidase [Alphaproteobacteria bacterium]|nr:prolyl oligopeptidase family serine peptidase [Alphaproteobacteria bacterium]
MLRNLLRSIVLGGASAAVIASAADAASNDDPYLWLEEVEGERALEWVRARNAEGQSALEATPLFPKMLSEAKAILTSEARIPYGAVHAGKVYNFWQDANHVRGLWRRATVKSYRAGAPEWETVIDYDALAKEEGRNWVRGSVSCLAPGYVHCMIELSDGGKDAGYWREFNTETKSFVNGWFSLPEGKSNVSWLDENTLLVGHDRGENSLTTSGYPRTSVLWSRGETIGEAKVILAGQASDVGAGAFAEHDGEAVYVFGYRSPSFFERIYSLQTKDGEFAPLPWPLNMSYEGVLDGRAIIYLREDWAHDGALYPSGDVVAYDLSSGAVESVFSANDRQSVEDIEVGKSSVVIQYLDDVAGKAARIIRAADGSWKAKGFALPEHGVVSIVSAGGGTDEAFFSFESLTMPDALYYADAGTRLTKVMSLPELYDASDVVVEQRFATSRDGVAIPYFVMAERETLEAGDAPTVQYAYGGFLSPVLPVYFADPGRPQHGALAGKMWIDRGGVLVLSNIRGGSEYGPKWHKAALRENRQKAFDDFIAISESLIATGVTSAEKLGAVGRSNGGLLMGAILTQRPELYAAIDIGVPLFDMLRYHKLLAGASWIGEYGNPDVPEERAFIAEYSPYQNLEEGKPYPKTLIYTSTKDDRVHPGHARKAAAKLRDLGHELFYYENIEGGHGGTANQEQLAYRTALEYAYFAFMLMGNAPAAGEASGD